MGRRLLALGVAAGIGVSGWLLAQPVGDPLMEGFRLVEVASVSEAMGQLSGQGSDRSQATGTVYIDEKKNARNLKTMCETADSLLKNPSATFGQQADRCVCCHRWLTDLTSRTRGIGPE